MERKITAREIIVEVARNMQEGLERLEYTVLAPNHYDVYLTEADYEELRPLFAEIRREAVQKLDEALASLNDRESRKRPALRLPWRKDDGPERYERKGAAWEIEFCLDHEPEAQPGDLTVHSYFTADRASEAVAGARTQRLQPRGDGSATARLGGAGAPGGEVAVASGAPVARIRYADRNGEQTFEMTKDVIVVGRLDPDGRGYWADLKLDTRPDVSREHVRIRRDPSDGRFYLKDLSKFGTRIDGEAVPSSLTVVDGERQDRDAWVELPDRAEIDLAGVLALHFEAER